MPETNGVSQAAKMKITLWAGANKERFTKLSIAESRDLIKKEFGCELTRGALLAVFHALDLKPARRRYHGNAPTAVDQRLRMLARILRKFMKEAGATDIPPVLNDLCDGKPVEEETNGAAH